jgi:probable DNA metabolism protein
MAYLAHAPASMVRLAYSEDIQLALDERVAMPLETRSDSSLALSRRVYKGFERHVSMGCPLRRGTLCPTHCKGSCASRLALAAANDDQDVPEAIHRYVRLGCKEGSLIRSMLSDKTVTELDRLARYTLSECEHTRQFVRFSQLSDGTYFSAFRPKADTVPLTCNYFAARMRGDRFCLLDPTHHVIAMHEEGDHRCAVNRLDDRLTRELSEHASDLAEGETYVHAMWKRFYDSVGLDGRDSSQRGYDLRASWMPKRFWGGLTELDPTLESAMQADIPDPPSA